MNAEDSPGVHLRVHIERLNPTPLSTLLRALADVAQKAEGDYHQVAMESVNMTVGDRHAQLSALLRVSAEEVIAGHACEASEDAE